MPLRPCITCGALSRTNYCPAHNYGRAKRTGSTRRWRTTRAQVIARDGRCVRCGSTTSLEAHHIDGNPHRDDPANLQTLCRTCHAQGRRP